MNNEEIGKITISMDEEYAETLIKALDLYTRISMGQFDEILSISQFNQKDWEYKDAAKEHLKNAKMILMPELLHPNAYTGIAAENLSEKAKLAYELQKMVVHDLAWFRNPEGSNWNVNFQKPLKVSSSSGFPTVQIESK